MSEIEAAIKRHKKRAYNIYEEEKDDRKISQIFSKILISIIIILICTIYIKLSPDNLSAFKSIVFENSMAFNKINNLYHSLFGSVLPSDKDNTVGVNNTVGAYEKYLDGVKIHVDKGSTISSITSGILVYQGQKEGLGNTLIVQGVDGTDIWYSGLTNSNYKLYDYIETGTILGECIDNYYILTLYKDRKLLDYEDYIKSI